MAVPVLLIAAMDEARGAGLSTSPDGLPWKIPEEMAVFKKLTMPPPGKRHALVMGGTTYRTLLARQEKRPIADFAAEKTPLRLPGREIFLFSRTAHPVFPTLLSLRDMPEGFDLVFLCGGVQTYLEALREDVVDGLILSRIRGTFACDAFLPPFEENFEKIASFDAHSSLFTTDFYVKWGEKTPARRAVRDLCQALSQCGEKEPSFSHKEQAE